MSTKKVTIKDVSKEAGVSTSLVSFVFNNRPNVNQETAELVKRTAEKLGYTHEVGAKRRGPKPGHRKCKATQNFTICLLCGKPENLWRIPIYAELAHGVEKAASALGHHVLLKNLTNEETSLYNLKNVADGIIMLAGSNKLKNTLTQKSQLPIVQVMGLPECFNCVDHITYDNDMVGLLAASHTLQNGHLNCAVIHRVADAQQRIAANFAEEVSANGGCVTKFEVGYDIEDVAKIVDIILKRKPTPTIIFCSVDNITVQLYPILYSKGLIPGKDIDVISVDNDDTVLRNITPRPVSIDLGTEEIGRLAVERLMWRKENPKAPNIKLLVSPRLPLQAANVT